MFQVIDLTKTQEVTKQHEAKEREAQAMAQAALLNKVCCPSAPRFDMNTAARCPVCIHMDRIVELSQTCIQHAAPSVPACLRIMYPQEREQVRYQEERQLEEQRAQVGARMKQYEDELARKRIMHEHELQRQRNAELVKLQVRNGMGLWKLHMLGSLLQ